MSKRRSKLKDLAEAGDPWAIETLARMQAQGRQAGLRGAAMQRTSARAKGPTFSEAIRDAADIRRWTDGPNPAPWRIYRLAQALTEARHA
jgi:hypothetical protein